MPKRARTAHIPTQAARKRKAKRRDGVVTGADAYLDARAPVMPAAYGAREPAGPVSFGTAAATRPPSRSAAAPRSGTARAAGQLPTFERAYLVDELKRITMISGSLLVLIVVLFIVLR